MSSVMESILQFMLYAVVAMFVENAVLARGFGVSRLVKLVGDGTVDSLIFSGILLFVQVVSAPLGYFLNQWLAQPQYWFRDYVRPLAFAVAAIVAFGLALGLVQLLPLGRKKEIMATLPMATFNLALFGPILISAARNFNLVQTMGFAVGSGLGYALVVLMVSEGKRRMNNARIPTNLRGLPINLIYISILALAIYGFTGHRLDV